VFSLTVLQDGTLASGRIDTTIQFWDTKTGQSTKVLNGHTSFVNSLTVLQDGTLASDGGDKTIRIVNMKTGQSTKVLNGHTRLVLSLSVLQDGTLTSDVETQQSDYVTRKQVNQKKY